jgi:TIR domain
VATAVIGTATTTAPMIFLSYRRDDSAGHVGRLYDALSAKFGSQRIFVDIDHISAGQDFKEVVDDAVARCAVLLVVMGKRWAGSGRVGKRRIDNPGDFVRLEVAGGLARQGLRVIPVLVGGATMPGPTELPDDIKDLARRNAFELSDTRWKEDVARLIAQLDQTIGPMSAPARVAVPISIPKLPTTIKLPAGLPTALPRWAKWAGGAVAALLLVLLVRGIAGHGSASSTPTVSAVVPAPVTIAPDPPKALPVGVPDAAQRNLADVRREWRPDAVLTQITARLHAEQGAATYELDYALRSPTDGDGLQIATGIPGAQPTSKTLAPISRTSIHALPSGFVDFPTAVQTARDAGLVGDVRTGLLSASFVERRGQPTWRLVGSGDAPMYVDGASGAVLSGTYTLPAGSGTGSSTHGGQNPIQALKGLFHKH